MLQVDDIEQPIMTVLLYQLLDGLALKDDVIVTTKIGVVAVDGCVGQQSHTRNNALVLVGFQGDALGLSLVLEADEVFLHSREVHEADRQQSQRVVVEVVDGNSVNVHDLMCCLFNGYSYIVLRP